MMSPVMISKIIKRKMRFLNGEKKEKVGSDKIGSFVQG